MAVIQTQENNTVGSVTGSQVTFHMCFVLSSATSQPAISSRGICSVPTLKFIPSLFSCKPQNLLGFCASIIVVPILIFIGRLMAA